jgi:hypothetical protein
MSPIQSKAQQGAMYAAASGHSTLGIPKSVGQEFVNAGPAKPSFSSLPGHAVSAAAHLGVSASKPKKKKHSGRGKPGASHLAQLTQAHGQGQFQQAKVHALNYANAVTKHLTGTPTPMADNAADDSETDDMTPTPAAPPSTAAPSAPSGSSSGVSKLSQFAAMMRKRAG